MKNSEDLPKPILIKDLDFLFANENSNQKRHYGIFKCGLCGTEFKTMIDNVKRGNTKSCGCHRKRRVSETHKTHGLSKSKLSEAWSNIKNRTLNPRNKDYKDYGGRGINICEEWLDIHNFYNWAMSNGYSEGLSIDRIDNDGNYCPENCRWTTKTVQARNKGIYKNNTSGYKGVSYRKDIKKYQAVITVNKKRIQLGHFQTAVEGAIAYNNYIIENNLEGYNLNEIP